MSDNVTLTPEEIQAVTIVRDRYDALTRRAGQVAIQELLIKSEKLALEKELATVELERVKVMGELQTKYGYGDVNLATGDFTPAAPAQTK